MKTFQVVTSEPRPHKYENIALPRTYGISSETSPQNYYDRTSYRSVRNGETQLMQHVIPSSHNSNSNGDHVQGTEIVTASSQASGIIPSARSYSSGVLDQTLELQIERSRSHHSAQSNPGDAHWKNKEEQTDTNKTGMEYSHQTVAEDKIKSHQIFNTSVATNPDRQYSQRENVYDHTQQNISKVSIYSGKFDSNQSGVIDYLSEEKVSKNATLSTTQFSNTLKNETHQIEMLGKHHGNEQLTLHRQPGGRDAAVLEQSVENTTQKHTILTTTQSSYSNKYDGYGVTSTIGYLMDVLEEKHSGPYNTSSLAQGQDTEQMAIPTSQQFSPSESVFSTPVSAKSDAPMSYSQPNSGDEHEPRMHSSLVFKWKNQWTMKDQNASQYMDNSGGSKIIFPGEPEGYSVPKFTPEVSGQQPKCADEDGFCESADNYPVDYVRRIFQNEANSYIFGSDLMDVNLRINPDEEVSLCPSMEQVVYPKVAQNKDDKWLYIINQETYFQGIRIEKCAKQGSCTFAENFPNGYTTSCQQKYIYRKLIALGEDGRPVTDSFRLPSCCSCVVTKSFRSRRMASDLGKSQIPSKRRRRR
ncbi:uncharacterized protein LOC111871744 isoform X3 [Cryptotermes secundus]|uniref:uncharacterized protein LOC111871744 isoform X3 n=1 Tax=Cryptotermes secundus TaxID=105785 RepID=UPI000CD7B39D|nr:uncharacterized protein LOC111871744 isoform X3 [Cryptotermes secundus]